MPELEKFWIIWGRTCSISSFVSTFDTSNLSLISLADFEDVKLFSYDVGDFHKACDVVTLSLAEF